MLLDALREYESCSELAAAGHRLMFVHTHSSLAPSRNCGTLVFRHHNGSSFCGSLNKQMHIFLEPSPLLLRLSAAVGDLFHDWANWDQQLWKQLNASPWQIESEWNEFTNIVSNKGNLLPIHQDHGYSVAAENEKRHECA
jgi:hypothetical protein